MLNYILSKFGLMKIKRAENIGAQIHEHYIKCVLNEVEKEFNVVPKPDALQRGIEWWRETFKELENAHKDDVMIYNEAEFKQEK